MRKSDKVQDEIELYVFAMMEEMIRCRMYPWWITDRETTFRLYETSYEIAEFGRARELISKERMTQIIECLIEDITTFYTKRKERFGDIPEDWKDIFKISDKKYIDSFIKECDKENIEYEKIIERKNKR